MKQIDIPSVGATPKISREDNVDTANNPQRGSLGIDWKEMRLVTRYPKVSAKACPQTARIPLGSDQAVVCVVFRSGLYLSDLRFKLICYAYLMIRLTMWFMFRNV